MAKILIADDVAAVAEAIAVTLARAGHDCVLHADGDAALAGFEAGNFDLVILDVWMPRRSGLEVLKVLRAQSRRLPVILVSGGGPGASLEQATAIGDLHGADRILYKPFEDEELLEAVAVLLG